VGFESFLKRRLRRFFDGFLDIVGDDRSFEATKGVQIEEGCVIALVVETFEGNTSGLRIPQNACARPRSFPLRSNWGHTTKRAIMNLNFQYPPRSIELRDAHHVLVTKYTV
jgi:hypothetical protein